LNHSKQFAALLAAAMVGFVPMSRAQSVSAQAPTHDWSGFYLGVDVGYSWSNRNREAYNAVNGAFLGFSTGHTEGPLGGVHAGYNFNFTPEIVAGGEIDVFADGANGSELVVAGPPGNSGTAQSQAHWSGRFRARLGYVIPNMPVLAFMSLGMAWTDSTAERHQVTGTTGNAHPGTTDRVSIFATGLSAGAGAEFALARNWTVRAEYLYSDFETHTTFPTFQRSSKDKGTRHTVLTGLSYQF